MHQTNVMREVEVLQDRAAVTHTHPGAGSRLTYVDAIRTVLIILVIMVHAAVTYGSLGDWTYEDPVQEEMSSILLSFFVILCQSFFMGLLFFYSGYFTPGSYDRKGVGGFWKDRLLRLAVPMVAYTWFLSKVPNYINQFANNGMRWSFLEYTWRTFWSSADKGPTWFLFALLIFTIGYTLWRLITHLIRPGDRLWMRRLAAPRTITLLGFALIMALGLLAVVQTVPFGETFTVLWIFDLQMGFFPQYILLFIAGILAYRNGWLALLQGKSLRFWGWLSAALAIFLPVFFFVGGAPDGHLDEFMTGMNWRCILLSLWMGFACISFSMTLTLWMRDRVKPHGRLAEFAGRNNFAVYLIHPLVLVPITFGLSFLTIHPLVKFGIASILTVSVCYLLADALRRLPGVKAIL